MKQTSNSTGLAYETPDSSVFYISTEQNFALSTQTSGLHQMTQHVDIYDEDFDSI